MSCREEVLLEAYLNGERPDLPPEVWEHVGRCARCRTLLEVHQGLVEASRIPLIPDALAEEHRLMRTIRHASRRQRLLKWGLGAIAVAAGLLLFLTQSRPPLRPLPLSGSLTSPPVLIYPEEGAVLENGRLTLVIQTTHPGAEVVAVEVDGQALEAWMERQENTWFLENFYLPEEGPHEIRIRIRTGRETLQVERVVYTGGFSL